MSNTSYLSLHVLVYGKSPQNASTIVPELCTHMIHMSERARERVSVRECESDERERGERRVPEGLEGETRIDAEGDDFMGVRSRAKKGSFGVESKWFDVEVREQKGKVQALIVERKGGVSSWIRLGPNSNGCFIDGLEACIENAGTGTWERKWKDSGRSFLMVQDQNKGGLFIRLGVTDLENKRFNIYIPNGRGDKSG